MSNAAKNDVHAASSRSTGAIHGVKVVKGINKYWKKEEIHTRSGRMRLPEVYALQVDEMVVTPIPSNYEEDQKFLAEMRSLCSNAQAKILKETGVKARIKAKIIDSGPEKGMVTIARFPVEEDKKIKAKSK